MVARICLIVALPSACIGERCWGCLGRCDSGDDRGRESSHTWGRLLGNTVSTLSGVMLIRSFIRRIVPWFHVTSLTIR